jgi:hypothetical protein
MPLPNRLASATLCFDKYHGKLVGELLFNKSASDRSMLSFSVALRQQEGRAPLTAFSAGQPTISYLFDEERWLALTHLTREAP